jgi:phage tail sheath protein FI
MPVQVSYPGVYVQEVPSGVRTIVGVSTSIALFIGRTKQGPLNKPTQCFNYSDFERTFSSDSSVSDMARYVKLFFMNGGTQCYVMRIARDAEAAEVTLQSEEPSINVLLLTAKQVGLIGETIRVAVTYNGLQPESTFNTTIFRYETDTAGNQVQTDMEEWNGLSMNPNSSLYAPDFITQNSKLVDASLATGIPDPVDGFSQSGRPVFYDSGTPSSFRDAWAALIGAAGTDNQFQISVDGSSYVPVDLSGIDVAALTGPDFEGQLITEMEKVINAAFTLAGILGTTVDVSFETGPAPGSNFPATPNTSLLRISSASQGDVYIRPSTSNDAAVPLMLGTSQGGLEVSAHAARRPAPTGVILRGSDPDVLRQFAALSQDDVNQITLPAVQSDGTPTTVNITLDLETTDADDPMFRDASSTSTDNNSGVREKLGLIRDAINDHQQSNPRSFFWKAELWGSRLAILPTGGEDNDIGTIATATTDIPTAIANSFTQNVRYYSVGAGGTAGLQVPGALASDGFAPQISDYDDAYEIIDQEVDLFNLMILPPDAEQVVAMSDLYGPASVFCQNRRAFLLMDAPADWTTAQTAVDNVDGMRIGLVKDYSAIFYPRITINEDGLKKNIGPSGAIAGLMARIDGTRGVWKAPAGTEADLRGVVGLEYKFSDSENGVLNPRAINTIRIFPNGIVNWGARTMDGDDYFASEYKYIPVRRLALFMEESLYRGLKWVVFEPNDEPLWAQIRLNVGAFMHGLFRQGAFQGKTPKEAYFVKCDKETTTQNDINLGIVNIWVGFAPLKPAEFVVLYLQQMAGQVEV